MVVVCNLKRRANHKVLYYGEHRLIIEHMLAVLYSLILFEFKLIQSVSILCLERINYVSL
jgi:hypothetical protein